MLIAGVGNIFLGDDAFGPEVARRLAAEDLPGWVRVADYGISGMHLAYDLADGYETAILIDAAPRGGEPGTVTVLEVAAEHRRDLAVPCFLDFRKFPKSGARTLFKLGQAYEQLGDRARAVRCYQQVTAYDGNPLAPDAYEAINRLQGA